LEDLIVSIQSDAWIRRMALDYRMIVPFSERSEGRGVISFGLSSYGYDVRVARDFKVFTNLHSAIIDPKAFRPDAFVDISGDVCVIPPNSFALARTVEYFRIPEDVITICVGKSTYARCGIIVNVTPFEPGWEGSATLEISNTTPLPAKVYANEGIAQVLFFKGAERCERTYADRKGKYQGQTEITLPKVT
jgi:dCTP deaminase